METPGKELKTVTEISVKRIRTIVRDQRIADSAVSKAIEENRRLGLVDSYLPIQSGPFDGFAGLSLDKK